jgi:hypothetical protein
MPPAPTVPAIEPRLRHARAAVSVVFLINAVLYANLVPRLPEVKDRLNLSNAELGSGIAAMPVGSLPRSSSVSDRRRSPYSAS